MSLIRTLIIEDNPIQAELLKELLSEDKTDSFVIEWASSLSAGLEYLNKSKFNLLLLDLSLPDAEGFEACEKVKGVAPSLPMVIISGYQEDEKTMMEF